MVALHDLSILECGNLIRAGKLTSTVLTQHFLQRIEKLDEKIHSFVTPVPEMAMREAGARDSELAQGMDRGPLHGIPFGVKDLLDAAGVRTTYGSAHFQDNEPALADAELVASLRQAGAVLLGKQTTHEFGFGGPSFDLPDPPARNPWNHHHYAGGSSSGSAAAVAAGIGRFAIGTDAGGSICSPAALCGVVGLKPTYGLLSRDGGWGSSPTLGHNGVLARTVEDAAIVLDMATARARDHASSNYSAGLEDGVQGIRIGIPRNFLKASPSPHPEILTGVERIAGLLREAGAIVEDFSLPEFDLFAACGRVIIQVEAYARHEPLLRSAPEKYGAITRRQLLLGPAISAADYLDALRMKEVLSRKTLHACSSFDAILALGVHGPAPRMEDVGKMPWLVRQQHIHNNITGMPAISVPTFLADGLPASVLLSTLPSEERTLFRVARAIERHCGWQGRIPPELDTPD